MGYDLHFPPSGSSQWLNCPMAAWLLTLTDERRPPETRLRYSQKLVGPTPQYTIDGTTAHSYLETLLNAPSEDAEDISDKMKAFAGSKFPSIPDEEKKLLNMVADDVWFTKVFGGYELKTEQKVGISYGGYETEGGTIDVLLLREDAAYIIDLKWGEGQAVEVRENTQLSCYALGVRQAYPDLKCITFGIYQPRGNGAGLTFWEPDFEYLDDFEKRASDEISKSKVVCHASDKYDPGKHCFWCPGRRKGLCPELLHHTIITSVSDTDPALPISEYPTWILDRAENIRGLVKGVEDNVDSMLARGVPVPGWRLENVEGNSTWEHAEEVPQGLADALGGEPDDYVRQNPKPITITDARKLAKRKSVSVEHLITNKKKTVRVRSSDSDFEAPAVVEPVE